MADRVPIFNAAAWAYDFVTDQKYWRDLIVRLLDHVDTSREGLRLLDLGCGPGVSTLALAGRLRPDARLIGVDLAERMIDRARRHHTERFPGVRNVRFQQADANRLPFDDGDFDVATGHSFLYMIRDPGAVLREIRRVLAPGGSIVLMEPHAGGSLLRAAVAARGQGGEVLRHPVPVLRFCLSMVSWRVFSVANGQLTPADVSRLFLEAGFRHVTTQATFGDLGLHCVGRV